MTKLQMALFGVCLLVACTARPETIPSPQDALPAGDAVAGWHRSEDAKIYDRETLYDHMNGAADLYFTYGFEALAVGRYENGAGAALQVEVYRVATDADAYGLFTYNSFGEPVALGVDGEIDSGLRLATWQRRTFVQILTQGEVSDETLRAFGRAFLEGLPEGGQRPVLAEALPEEGMLPGSLRFFRQQMALDNLLWLGSEDVLSLQEDAEGVLARYEIDGQGADLLMVRFPDAQRTLSAQAGLLGANIENLVAAEARENTLGAVFGQLSGEAAERLVTKALDAVP